MDEAAAIESPPWNPAPPSPNKEIDHSPIHSVRQQLQEDLERCSAEDSVGETIYSRSWLLSLLVKAVDYVQSENEKAYDTPDPVPLPPSGPSTTNSSGIDGSLEADSKERATDLPISTVKEDGDKCGGGDVTVARRHDEHLCSDGDGTRVTPHPKDGNRHPRELDEDMENDMCKLWDTSVNEVSECLQTDSLTNVLVHLTY